MSWPPPPPRRVLSRRASPLAMFPLLLQLLSLLPLRVFPLRILQIVPGFTNSHVLFNYRLANTLSRMGHNVTLWTQMEMAMVFTGDFRLPEGVTELRVPIHFKDRLKVEGLKVFQEMIFARGTPYELWWTGREFQDMRLEACEQMLAQANAMIWVTHGTSLYDFTAVSLGVRTFPSFVPHPLSSNGDSMDFFGRLINVLWHLSGIEFVNLPESLLHDENRMYQQMFGDDGAGDLWELSAHTVGVLLINGERFLDFARPLPHNIVFMGELEDNAVGTKVSEQDLLDLDPDLAAVYGREGSQGIVVFSMGTVSNTSNMPPSMATCFLEAFGRMGEFDFLWKTEQTELEGADKFPNVHLRRWIPQKKLMAHPKTRLLLAHGGYNSFLEASKAGLPIVLVPLFADQHINAQRARRFGIAETLDKLALSAEAVERALRRVLGESRWVVEKPQGNGYALNARRLSTMLTDKPPARIPPPIALRHSLKMALAPRPAMFVLRSAQSLSFIQFHCIDVALLLAALVATGAMLG